VDVEKIRDVIKFALDHLQGDLVRVKALGNRVHLYVGDDEYEIVIKTIGSECPTFLDDASPSS
jgi:hypothetical protein